MNLLEKAIILATNKHAGQVDKGGNIYIEHPLRLMTKMDTIEEKIVAVLHDIVEDTDCSLDDLRKEGFPENIVTAVDCLTRKKDETYKEFILRIRENPLAKKVKLRDIFDNMDLSRIPNPTEKDYERIEKRYKPAIVCLTEVM